LVFISLPVFSQGKAYKTLLDFKLRGENAVKML